MNDGADKAEIHSLGIVTATMRTLVDDRRWMLEFHSGDRSGSSRMRCGGVGRRTACHTTSAWMGSGAGAIMHSSLYQLFTIIILSPEQKTDPP